MKFNLFAIFLLLTVFICFSSCSKNTAVSDPPDGEHENAIPEHAKERSEEQEAAAQKEKSSQPEVLLDEPYYQLLEGPKFQYYYYIYDDKKEIVLEGALTRYPALSFLDDDIVRLHIGMGTGIALDQYYSVTKDSLSRIYQYAVAYHQEKIAYIYIPNTESSFTNRILIVRNVFDKSKYYKEFMLDFSPAASPITGAEFTSENQLKVTYQTGEDYTEITEILELY